MRMGLERLGWKVTFANDIDPDKLEIYSGQFNDASDHFVLGDVHKIDASDIPIVTLATASFPCNDLSLAGARVGLAGQHSGAYWGFTAALERMGDRKPPLVLLENVVGFLSSRGGSDFRMALLELNRLGYSVDAFILDAARFVPQSRQRLFVIGIHNSLLSLAARDKTRGFLESDVRPKALADFMLFDTEIQWCMRNLPDQPTRLIDLPEIIEDLPDDAPEWWSHDRALYLLNQMSARHREIADEMILSNGLRYGSVFRRVRNGKSMAEMRTDGIAGCLRTPRGGSGRQILFKAGNDRYQVRLFTPNECARLMGADGYNLTGISSNKALFGFGDAVCVPAIEWIAANYLEPLVLELREKQTLTLAG